ncbi:MAG: riboflavin synthase [Polyangiaceae bacterium]
MFTGLVECRGTVRERTARPKGARLVLGTSFDVDADPFALGESIAVDGVCLTVQEILPNGSFVAEASQETLDRTTLGRLAPGARVNLERAAKVGSRLGGHIVGGHVDGIAKLTTKRNVGTSVELTFVLPKGLAPLVAEKGSVCLNGISLTVNAVHGLHFRVMIVPHTQSVTGFDALVVGADVNLEVDVLARYVARALEAKSEVDDTESPGPADDPFLGTLTRAGYVAP